MGSKRGSRRDASLGFSTLVAVAVGLLYLPNNLVRACFVLFLITTWVALFRKTTCDVKNKSKPGYCGNNCRGALRACWRKDHQRIKRKTIVSWFGVRGRPEPRWERAVYTPGEQLILQQGPPPVRVSVERDSFDKLTLAVSVASLAGTLLPLFLK